MREKLLKHLTDNQFHPDNIRMLLGAFDKYIEDGLNETDAVNKLKSEYFRPKASEEEAESKQAKASVNYRNTLANNLKSYNYTPTVLEQIWENYDYLAKKKSESQAFAFCSNEFTPRETSKMLESYANSLLCTQSTPTSRLLQSELNRANETIKIEKPSPEKTSRSIREIIERYNKSIAGLSCTVNNAFVGRETEVLSPEEKNALRMKIPQREFTLKQNYQSWGSTREHLRDTFRGLVFEDESFNAI
jgi:hypothetical protein